MISKIQLSLLTCLVVYFAFLSSQVTWFLASPQDDSVIMLPNNRVVTESNVVNRSNLLRDFHLFGQEGAIKKVQLNEATVAPETRLRLLLKGVFTSENGGQAGAIVEEIGKNANYYQVGETLPGNAVLEEVFSDRILLRRNGGLETLTFEDKNINATNRIAAGAISDSNRNIITGTDRQVSSPEEFMSEATRRLADNPEQALGSVGLKASSGGYVYQGGNPMLAGLNLQKGDVIKSVNGHALGDVKKDKALMKSFYEQGSLEVEIARDGASFYINYPLR